MMEYQQCTNTEFTKINGRNLENAGESSSIIDSTIIHPLFLTFVALRFEN
jgi:hypothetical protein